MTIDVKFGTVIASIAALVISGVNVKDTDEIPENADVQLPVLFPDPDQTVTDLQPQRVSFGAGGSAAIDMTYTLNYVYLHSKVGNALTVNNNIPQVLSAVALILETMFANDDISGAIDLENSAVQIGVIVGPNGSQYHGSRFSFRVMEHVQ